jgi:4'-phosphopantetheinyl transferase
VLKTKKRQREWLLGRWTAKHLIKAYLEDICDREFFNNPDKIAFEMILIENNPYGMPVVRTWNSHEKQETLQDLPISLSISHSSGSAFCALLPRGEAEAGKAAIGADMELIEPRSPAFVEDYFTRVETEIVAKAAPDDRSRLVTLIWSAKEAALKALGQGLRLDTRSLSCLIIAGPQLQQEWQPFAIQWEADPEILAGSKLAGWWLVSGGFAYTLVVRGDPSWVGKFSGPSQFCLGESV